MMQNLKKDLELRKKEYAYEWLGRSLAYNNYPPRDIKPLFEGKFEAIRYIEDFKLDEIKKYENFNLVSIGNDKELLDPEVLTVLRRYTKSLIIRSDSIFDEYQLLESVVYGADSVVLRAKDLKRAELKALIDFSRRLGMEPIVEINNKEELTKAIFCSVDILSFESQELITLIPTNKILISTLKIEKSNGFSGYFTKE